MTSARIPRGRGDVPDKIKISLPIITEGKYDKNTLKQIFDATVITCDGFGIFKSREKQILIQRLAKDGIIVLTDSDGGGKVIRSFLSGIVPKEKVYNLYIPKIKGKERRKTAPSKEGYLGVEGMGRDELVRVFSPFINTQDKDEPSPRKRGEMITKVDFYCDKLTGADNSSAMRDALAREFGLPDGMSANALMEALNLIADREEYKSKVAKISAKESNS